MDVAEVLARYASGLFPMDGWEHSGGPLPFYIADPRTIFELGEAERAAVRRRVRRSLRKGEGWTLERDRAFEQVLAGCARPRAEGDGVWITPRMERLYRALHGAGFAHSYEIWAGGELAAGLLSVRLRRAAMLESMCHWRPDAGNVLVSRTLDALALEEGAELCDLQLATPHTTRLGAVQIPRAEYEARLRAALR